MTRVPIAVQPCPYDAIIENGLLERAGEHLRGRVGNRQHLFIVTVPPVRRRWGKKLMRSLGSAGLQSRLIEMRDGERAKKLATVEALAEKLTQLGADRDSVIVAFGSICDRKVAGRDAGGTRAPCLADDSLLSTGRCFSGRISCRLAAGI